MILDNSSVVWIIFAYVRIDGRLHMSRWYTDDLLVLSLDWLIKYNPALLQVLQGKNHVHKVHVILFVGRWGTVKLIDSPPPNL